MKKILLYLFAIILAVSMVFTMAPLSMEHAYADDTTITIDGVKYTLNDDGTTATVSGHIDELSGDVIIPSTINDQQYTITSIGEGAFFGCKGLEAITIPESVTSIGAYAFNACTGLKSITIPESVTSIGAYAFNACTGLKSITIPKGVTSIKERTFKESGLTSVTFADESNLTSIGKSAFDSCKSLETITIPESVTSIGAYAFNTCTGLKSITIPKGVTSIKEGTFRESGLTSVTFADESNLTTIEKYAFIYCYSLETITIPESVTSIGEGAFYSCANLEAINIPAGVESIGNYAFSGCAKISTVTIPASVTSIGESAFSGCKSLTTVTIPVSVQTIETDAFTNAPLETVYYYGTRTQWNRIEGDGKPMDVAVYYIKVENNVVYILNYLGQGTHGRATVSGHTDGLLEKDNVRIENLVLSDNVYYSVRSIEENAFKDCSSLKTVTIPRDVTFIGKGAFDGTSLTTVNFQGTRPQWDRITGDGKPDNVTVNCEPITIDHINYDCYNDGTAVVCGYITSLPAEVEIPSIVSRGRDYTVTSIRQDAFLNCDSLESVSIPASVESIGQGAFYGSGVKTVTIEENSKLKNIGQDAFLNCDSLESVSIPASVESIGQAAFCGCTSLKTVAFEENSKLKSIELNTFETCTSLESVIIPVGVESIGEGAFCGCENLKSVSIPASVESIGKSAFNTCTSLSYVTIPASVISIHAAAFYKCNALTTLNYLGSKAQWDAVNADAGLQVTNGQDIIFKNSDGTELQYSSVKSGLTPQYVGETPTKDADDQYTYTFAGWDPEITEVTGTATYKAKYDATNKATSIQGANVVLSAASLTYNGAVQRPAISAIGNWNLAEGTDYTAAWSNAASKDIGTYSVTVTGKGKYKDSAAASYQIVPKGTTLKKPKKAKKAVTVKWKKQKTKMPKARITGYRIQLATDSNFTMNVKTVNVKGYKKTSKKVKKLKGKTMYYVRVCTYMKSGGNTYCSPWSKARSVKTK